MADEGGRQRRRDDHLAGRRLEDRVADLVAVGLLRQVAGRAGRERPVHERAVLEGGQEHDAGAAARRDERVEDREAVPVAHPDVEQRHVGLLAEDLALGVLAVRARGHELELEALRDDVDEPGAVDGMVVREDEPDAYAGGRHGADARHRPAARREGTAHRRCLNTPQAGASRA